MRKKKNKKNVYKAMADMNGWQDAVETSMLVTATS